MDNAILKMAFVEVGLYAESIALQSSGDEAVLDVIVRGVNPEQGINNFADRAAPAAGGEWELVKSAQDMDNSSLWFASFRVTGLPNATTLPSEPE